MTQDHDEPCAELFDGTFDAADLGRCNDVTGHTDDKQIPRALIEDYLNWHSRVCTSENDGGSFSDTNSLRRVGTMNVLIPRTSDTNAPLPTRKCSSYGRRNHLRPICLRV